MGTSKINPGLFH